MPWEPPRRPGSPKPRRVSNDVGGAVRGPTKNLPDWMPVAVLVSWDDGPKEPVEAFCLGWTAEHVHVHVTDPETNYSYLAWVPTDDVRRLPGFDD